jgi:hypothetical protein
MSMFAGALQVGVAALGLLVISPCPLASTATHNDDDGHERPER